MNVISDDDAVDPEAISELPTVAIHEVCDVHRAVLHTEADASTSKTSGRSTGDTAGSTAESVKSIVETKVPTAEASRSAAGTVGSTTEAPGSATVGAASDAALTRSSSPDVAEETTAETQAAATSHHTQPWFVGEMTRDRCLQYMRGAVKGQFVIRRSKVNRWQTSQKPLLPFFPKVSSNIKSKVQISY